MLTEIYIEALLVDEELADQVWDVWEIVVSNDAEGTQLHQFTLFLASYMIGVYDPSDDKRKEEHNAGYCDIVVLLDFGGRISSTFRIRLSGFHDEWYMRGWQHPRH